MCAFTKAEHQVAKALMSGFDALVKALSPLIDTRQDGEDGSQEPSMCIKYEGNGIYRVYAFTDRQHLLARALCSAYQTFDDVMVPVVGTLWPEGKLIVCCKESDTCAEDPSLSEDERRG